MSIPISRPPVYVIGFGGYQLNRLRQSVCVQVILRVSHPRPYLRPVALKITARWMYANGATFCFNFRVRLRLYSHLCRSLTSLQTAREGIDAILGESVNANPMSRLTPDGVVLRSFKSPCLPDAYQLLAAVQ